MEDFKMNNEMYLIHKDDYLNHIDNQLRLYVMVKQLALNIKRLAPNRGSKKISDMANNYNAIAESLFKSLGIPKSYILFGDEASLAELAACHVPPISKSGLNHRLERLIEYAEKIK